jgi:hypothetical protein
MRKPFVIANLADLDVAFKGRAGGLGAVMFLYYCPKEGGAYMS